MKWEDLTLLEKGQKTHALICLATGWRPASDIARTLASVEFTYDQGPEWPTSMVFTAIDVKEGGNKVTPYIPRLLKDQELCPVLATKRYLSETTVIRPQNSMFLFLSVNPPHQNLSADRLRNWLKNVMMAAGIEQIHTPHSIRAETTTTALESGGSIGTHTGLRKLV